MCMLLGSLLKKCLLPLASLAGSAFSMSLGDLGVSGVGVSLL